MSSKQLEFDVYTSEYNCGFTRNYKNTITPAQIQGRTAAEIPNNSRITNAKIYLEWKTSLSSNGDLDIYIGDTKVGGTYHSGNSYSPVSIDNLQGYFSSEQTYPGTSIGNIVLDFSATVIRTWYIRNYKIVFDIETPIFVVSTSVVGQGSVTGAGTYDVGTSATLKAIPSEGYKFVNWSDGNTDNPRLVTVSEGYQTAFTTNLSYTAVFEKIPPPEFAEASIIYSDAQVSQTNKVPTGQGFILSVGIKN